ncbi:hypothetical protein BYT27DRAFT_7248691 [Phlegmacium glaucopus]|nr:hypothetical protein BYT27DRAFT_7248691 [Phlegmacium glaucopus]
MASQTFDQRRLVGVQPERVINVSNTEHPGHYPHDDHFWNLPKFKKRLSNRFIEIDIAGVYASIVNAVRRIITAFPYVPTMCIKNVYVLDKTVIADEVLLHRPGLVPLNLDPTFMIMKKSINRPKPWIVTPLCSKSISLSAKLNRT